MIISRQAKVTFNNSETYPVDNLQFPSYYMAEFDFRGSHYCVRMFPDKNKKFKTMIGTWDDDRMAYIYEECKYITVTKIFRSEEYIDNSSEVE